jgi:uncharacterized protein (DUF1501 family)
MKARTTMPPTRRDVLSRLAFGQLPHVTDAGGRTLVCVFLRGGADTLNLVVPYADDQYYRSRPTLSIARPGQGGDAAIRLDDFFGFHPRLAPLLPLFSEGRLGIVQAVGTDNPTGSHFEAQDQIEHGEGYRAGLTVGGGWLGRYLRTRTGRADGPLAGVAIGATLPEALRGAPAASAFASLEEIDMPASSAESDAVTKALASMYASEVGLLGRQGRETLGLLRKVQALRQRGYAPGRGAEYPDDRFGRGLREVAGLIKADVGLEVACVDLDGWDTHFFQGTTGGQLADLADSLARGLAAFDADLASHRPRVTTVVLTEFGRRLYENGSAGTDHGRGFAMMAVGDAIRGGKVLGAWPGFEQDDLFPGPGGLRVKTDYRSVLAEVLRGPMKCEAIGKVFPGFAPRRVGLVA